MILKETLAQIINSQKEDLGPNKNVVKRDILGSIDLNPSFAIILTGIRRSGKSTLLKQLMQKLSAFNYFNFEDVRAANFELDDFLRLDDVFNLNKSKYLFFDEIQNINGWELFVRTALDKGKKIFVTGSNATLMSRELGTKLTGRHLKYEVFPFSYNEFLKFKKLKDCDESSVEYLDRGGFPEYLVSYNAHVLQTLFDDILIRDIIMRYGIRNTNILKSIAAYMVSNIGNLFTYSGIAKLFEIKSRISAQHYITFLEDSYLFFSVPMFSYSLKQQITNARKIYSIDNGFINANTLSFTEDKGRLLENLVFLSLRRKGKSVFYFKQKRECDFVVKRLNKIEDAIQVCFNLTSENQNREFDGLFGAMEFFKLKEGKVITFNQEDKLTIKGKIVNVIPLRKWLKREN